MTRVALSLDEAVLERARHHATVRRTSISKLFVSMVCMLDAEEMESVEIPPLTKQLKGLLKPATPLPVDFDYRQLLDDARMERFGRA